MGAFLESTTIRWEVARGLTVVVAAFGIGGLAVTLVKPCQLRVAENIFILAGSLASAFVSALLVHLRLDHWPASVRRGIVMLLVSAVALQFLVSNITGAASRARQKRAQAEIRGLATRLESGIKVQPGLDPWGHRYLISVVPGRGYSIVSLGECSESDIQPGAAYVAGTTNRTTDDIVLLNGQFIRYPEGMQNQ